MSTEDRRRTTQATGGTELHGSPAFEGGRDDTGASDQVSSSSLDTVAADARLMAPAESDQAHEPLQTDTVDDQSGAWVDEPDSDAHGAGEIEVLEWRPEANIVPEGERSER